MPITPRHLRRYRQIAEVLVSHGFGAILDQLELESRLNLARGLLRRWQTPQPETEADKTPARRLRLALEELGPTFVKLGQILSTRPDLLPPSYITELSRLQDQVPPAPWESIKACIEEELGDSLDQIFVSFDSTPIAAASLAQVHPAVLAGNQAVVVKVQRPNIEQTIEVDLDILYDLARLAQERTPLGDLYNLIEIAEDFAASLRAELDYRREGHNADRFRQNFTKEPHLYIPDIYWDYTTRRVVVQERIDGIKIDNIEALDAAGYDRHQIAIHAAHFIIQEVLEDGFFHADPHPGNVVVLPNEVIGLMDFGMIGHLPPDIRANLVHLYVVAIKFDSKGIVEQLIRLGVASQGLERGALQRDIHRLLIKYHSIPLKDIRAGEVIEELRPIMYRHRLRLPGDLWLLGKTLVMMEGIGLRLDPDFDIVAVSQPYVRRFVRQMWLPTGWDSSLLRDITNWGDLLSEFPRQTTHILTQLGRGELGVNIHLPEVEKTTNRVDAIANRVILSVLLAAFIVALALLIPTLNLAWPWGPVTWIIISGFVVVSFLGLWLMISILRSGGGL